MCSNFSSHKQANYTDVYYYVMFVKCAYPYIVYQVLLALFSCKL